MSSINHPPHYGGDTTYEVIKVIKAWGLGFNLGNVVKYIRRMEEKGAPIRDVEKGLWYLADFARDKGADVYQAIPTPEGEILTALSLALEHITEWEAESNSHVDEAFETLTKVSEILNACLERVNPTLAVSKKTKEVKK